MAGKTIDLKFKTTLEGTAHKDLKKLTDQLSQFKNTAEQSLKTMKAFTGTMGKFNASLHHGAKAYTKMTTSMQEMLKTNRKIISADNKRAKVLSDVSKQQVKLHNTHLRSIGVHEQLQDSVHKLTESYRGSGKLAVKFSKDTLKQMEKLDKVQASASRSAITAAKGQKQASEGVAKALNKQSKEASKALSLSQRLSQTLKKGKHEAIEYAKAFHNTVGTFKGWHRSITAMGRATIKLSKSITKNLVKGALVSLPRRFVSATKAAARFAWGFNNLVTAMRTAIQTLNKFGEGLVQSTRRFRIMESSWKTLTEVYGQSSQKFLAAFKKDIKAIADLTGEQVHEVQKGVSIIAAQGGVAAENALKLAIVSINIAKQEGIELAEAFDRVRDSADESGEGLAKMGETLKKYTTKELLGNNKAMEELIEKYGLINTKFERTGEVIEQIRKTWIRAKNAFFDRVDLDPNLKARLESILEFMKGVEKKAPQAADGFLKASDKFFVIMEAMRDGIGIVINAVKDIAVEAYDIVKGLTSGELKPTIKLGPLPYIGVNDNRVSTRIEQTTQRRDDAYLALDEANQKIEKYKNLIELHNEAVKQATGRERVQAEISLKLLKRKTDDEVIARNKLITEVEEHNKQIQILNREQEEAQSDNIKNLREKTSEVGDAFDDLKESVKESILEIDERGDVTSGSSKIATGEDGQAVFLHEAERTLFEEMVARLTEIESQHGKEGYRDKILNDLGLKQDETGKIIKEQITPLQERFKSMANEVFKGFTGVDNSIQNGNITLQGQFAWEKLQEVDRKAVRADFYTKSYNYYRDSLENSVESLLADQNYSTIQVEQLKQTGKFLASNASDIDKARAIQAAGLTIQQVDAHQKHMKSLGVEVDGSLLLTTARLDATNLDIFRKEANAAQTVFETYSEAFDGILDKNKSIAERATQGVAATLAVGAAIKPVAESLIILAAHQTGADASAGLAAFGKTADILASMATTFVSTTALSSKIAGPFAPLVGAFSAGAVGLAKKLQFDIAEDAENAEITRQWDQYVEQQKETVEGFKKLLAQREESYAAYKDRISYLGEGFEDEITKQYDKEIKTLKNILKHRLNALSSIGDDQAYTGTTTIYYVNPEYSDSETDASGSGTSGATTIPFVPGDPNDPNDPDSRLFIDPSRGVRGDPYGSTLKNIGPAIPGGDAPPGGYRDLSRLSDGGGYTPLPGYMDDRSGEDMPLRTLKVTVPEALSEAEIAAYLRERGITEYFPEKTRTVKNISAEKIQDSIKTFNEINKEVGELFGKFGETTEKAVDYRTQQFTFGQLRSEISASEVEKRAKLKQHLLDNAYSEEQAAHISATATKQGVNEMLQILDADRARGDISPSKTSSRVQGSYEEFYKQQLDKYRQGDLGLNTNEDLVNLFSENLAAGRPGLFIESMGRSLDLTDRNDMRFFGESLGLETSTPTEAKNLIQGWVRQATFKAQKQAFAENPNLTPAHIEGASASILLDPIARREYTILKDYQISQRKRDESTETDASIVRSMEGAEHQAALGAGYTKKLVEIMSSPEAYNQFRFDNMRAGRPATEFIYVDEKGTRHTTNLDLSSGQGIENLLGNRRVSVDVAGLSSRKTDTNLRVIWYNYYRSKGFTHEMMKDLGDVATEDLGDMVKINTAVNAGLRRRRRDRQAALETSANAAISGSTGGYGTQADTNRLLQQYGGSFLGPDFSGAAGLLGSSNQLAEIIQHNLDANVGGDYKSFEFAYDDPRTGVRMWETFDWGNKEHLRAAGLDPDSIAGQQEIDRFIRQAEFKVRVELISRIKDRYPEIGERLSEQLRNIDSLQELLDTRGILAQAFTSETEEGKAVREGQANWFNTFGDGSVTDDTGRRWKPEKKEKEPTPKSAPEPKLPTLKDFERWMFEINQARQRDYSIDQSVLSADALKYLQAMEAQAVGGGTPEQRNLLELRDTLKRTEGKSSESVKVTKDQLRVALNQYRQQTEATKKLEAIEAGQIKFNNETLKASEIKRLTYLSEKEFDNGQELVDRITNLGYNVSEGFALTAEEEKLLGEINQYNAEKDAAIQDKQHRAALENLRELNNLKSEFIRGNDAQNYALIRLHKLQQQGYTLDQVTAQQQADILKRLETTEGLESLENELAQTKIMTRQLKAIEDLYVLEEASLDELKSVYEGGVKRLIQNDYRLVGDQIIHRDKVKDYLAANADKNKAELEVKMIEGNDINYEFGQKNVEVLFDTGKKVTVGNQLVASQGKAQIEVLKLDGRSLQFQAAIEKNTRPRESSGGGGGFFGRLLKGIVGAATVIATGGAALPAVAAGIGGFVGGPAGTAISGLGGLAGGLAGGVTTGSNIVNPAGGILSAGGSASGVALANTGFLAGVEKVAGAFQKVGGFIDGAASIMSGISGFVTDARKFLDDPLDDAFGGGIQSIADSYNNIFNHGIKKSVESQERIEKSFSDFNNDFGRKSVETQQQNLEEMLNIAEAEQAQQERVIDLFGTLITEVSSLPYEIAKEMEDATVDEEGRPVTQAELDELRKASSLDWNDPNFPEHLQVLNPAKRAEEFRELLIKGIEAENTPDYMVSRIFDQLGLGGLGVAGTDKQAKRLIKGASDNDILKFIKKQIRDGADPVNVNAPYTAYSELADQINQYTQQLASDPIASAITLGGDINKGLTIATRNLEETNIRLAELTEQQIQLENEAKASSIEEISAKQLEDNNKLFDAAFKIFRPDADEDQNRLLSKDMIERLHELASAMWDAKKELANLGSIMGGADGQLGVMGGLHISEEELAARRKALEQTIKHGEYAIGWLNENVRKKLRLKDEARAAESARLAEEKAKEAERLAEEEKRRQERAASTFRTSSVTKEDTPQFEAILNERRRQSFDLSEEAFNADIPLDEGQEVRLLIQIGDQRLNDILIDLQESGFHRVAA